jgi:esterase/lipase superfamily enzyme
MSALTRGEPLGQSLRLLASAFLLLLVAGCAGRPLMPTPDLYAEGIREPFAALDPELRTSQVDLLYATDRLPEPAGDGELSYGYERSLSLAFGSALVEIGTDLSWDQLAQESRRRERSGGFALRLGKVTELGRFPVAPYPVTSEAWALGPLVIEERKRAMVRLQKEVERRLALTPRKEVFLFVHGYNNDFEDAAFTQAELWHFLGREGVPMIFSWPAGRGGLGGYAYDRESGEFAIFHFKELLRTLGSIPELDGVNILAHSRGTDVTVTMLRELIIESVAAGEDPLETYRIRNLVLAAADLDMEVFSQRIIAERLGRGIGQVTIYTSIGDKAISVSEMLFGSKRRVGRVAWSEMERELKAVVEPELAVIEKIDFVEHKGKAEFIGHGYFYNNPTASSDLILVLRYQLAPGTEQRPLKKRAPHFWVLEDGYLIRD